MFLIEKNQKLKLKKKTIFLDDQGNKFSFGKFKYNISNKTIKGKKIEYIDKQNDHYKFEDALVDLNSDEIIGKDISIKFDNSKFGNEKNNPRLKGNIVYANKNETVFLNLN